MSAGRRSRRRGALTRFAHRLYDSPRWLGALGVTAAVVLTCSLNVLASRFYLRWDLTPSGTYTLSSSTRSTLDQLGEPVEVIVFLSREDPLFQSLRLLLDEYTRASQSTSGPMLATRYVDPDRSVAEFVALQRELGIFEGKTQDGRLVSETSVVVRQGPRRWLIAAEDLVGVEPDGAAVRPRLEQALTDALHRVMRDEPSTVCLTSGHRELVDTDGSLGSIQEFQRRLERDNHELRPVRLGSAIQNQPFDGCQLVVIAAPAVAWASDDVDQLVRYFDAGGSVLAVLAPVVSDDGRVSSPDFQAFLEPLGLGIKPHVVLEQRPERIPANSATGVIFLAEPLPHAITAGLRAGDRARPVRVAFSSEVSVSEASPAIGLLASSSDAGIVDRLSGTDQGASPARDARDPAGNDRGQLVAAAYERPHEPIAGAVHEAQAHDPAGHEERTAPSRLVVLGSADLLDRSVWLDPRRLDDRAFIESAIAWLLAEAPLGDVAAEPSHPAGLSLTREGLGEVLRYVLIYMPLTALILAVLVLYRRRDVGSSQRAKQREVTS